MKTKSVAKQSNPIPNSKPFKKGTSGNPNGRPKKLKTQLKKAGFTLCEVEDIMKGFIALTPAQLTEYYNRKDCSILEKILIKSLQKDLANGQLINSVTILDRSYGKPKEKLESTSSITLSNFDISKLVAFEPTQKLE